MALCIFSTINPLLFFNGAIDGGAIVASSSCARKVGRPVNSF